MFKTEAEVQSRFVPHVQCLLSLINLQIQGEDPLNKSIVNK